MEKILFILFVASCLVSCHESLADKAMCEAAEYTRKNCPTPVRDNTRTDSVVFDKATSTYHYYYTLTGVMDDAMVIKAHQKELTDGLLKLIVSATGLKTYKDAGFNFEYTCHSQKIPSTVLFNVTFTKRDYSNGK